ncbi:hypothetical protein PROFUN_09795 [Planoprotostelium fungivorum]|uniref:VASt domain-containing protein n=1 Tax=Planoprotostelium fungivorum TaxID=1890364 RepID=A0A2P6NGM4_9EUKA|nr:hypothetical protein PROFUN_09795 [Planoprotostelium fungivorum]
MSKEEGWATKIDRLVNNVNATIERKTGYSGRVGGSPPETHRMMVDKKLSSSNVMEDLTETSTPLPVQPLSMSQIYPSSASSVSPIDVPHLSSAETPKSSPSSNHTSTSATPTKANTVDPDKITDFKLLFNLPGENLISDVMCALMERILLHGRMYISENYVCFHSSISSKSNKIIPFADIIDMQKKYTAILFPNGIEIRTAEKAYNFSSFLTRDETFTFLYNAWKSHWSKNPQLKAKFEAMEREREMEKCEALPNGTVELSDLDHSPQDLNMSTASRSGHFEMEKDYSNTTEEIDLEEKKRRSVSVSTGAELSRNNKAKSVKMNPIVSPKLARPVTHHAGVPAQKPATTQPDSAPVVEKKEAPLNASQEKILMPPVSSCTHSFRGEFTDAEFFIKTKINVPTVEKFYKAFVSGDWVLEVQQAQGLIENVLAPWTLNSAGCCLERDLNFVTPLNNRIGPKSTRVTSSHRCHMRAANVLAWEQLVVSHDVPYGDSFHIRTLILATGTSEGVIIQIGSILKWTKSVWGMKGIIEKFAQENNRNFANKMVMLMDQKISAGGVPQTPLITEASSTSTAVPAVTRPRNGSNVSAPMPLLANIPASPRITTVQAVPLSQMNATVSHGGDTFVDRTSRLRILGVCCVLYALTILPLWSSSRSAERRAAAAEKVAGTVGDKLNLLENFLALDPARGEEFNAFKRDHKLNRQVASQIKTLEDELRQMTERLGQMSGHYVADTLHEAADGGSILYNGDWLFWIVGLGLLSFAIFCFVKNKDRVSAYISASPAPASDHMKAD